MKLQSGLRILHPCICKCSSLHFDSSVLDTSKCVDYLLHSYHQMILVDFLRVYHCDLYTNQFHPVVNRITCWLYHHIFSTAHLYKVPIVYSFIHLVGAGECWRFLSLNVCPCYTLDTLYLVLVQYYVFYSICFLMCLFKVFKHLLFLPNTWIEDKDSQRI